MSGSSAPDIPGKMPLNALYVDHCSSGSVTKAIDSHACDPSLIPTETCMRYWCN